jgi:hypothetical protein
LIPVIENLPPRVLSREKPAGLRIKGEIMKSLRSKLLTVAIGGLALAAATSVAYGQNVNDQYRQWQRAQAVAQRECSRVRDRGDMRDCRQAQARAQREYNDYVRASRNTNSYYGNNGYYNNGQTVYNPSTGQYYRVYRNGQYYQTDYRGYNLLRQAVNSGYQQGYRQGQLDRRYGRGSNYFGNSLYMSGTFGYQSYVARDQYQYYFQQGFQRGYEDGYNNTFRYGTRSGSTFNILSNVLGTILNLATQP